MARLRVFTSESVASGPMTGTGKSRNCRLTKERATTGACPSRSRGTVSACVRQHDNQLGVTVRSDAPSSPRSARRLGRCRGSAIGTQRGTSRSLLARLQDVTMASPGCAPCLRITGNIGSLRLAIGTSRGICAERPTGMTDGRSRHQAQVETKPSRAWKP